MTTLYLSESDVERLLDMPTTIAVVEDAFRALAAGQADNVPRHRAQAKGVVLHSMSAAADYLGYVGWKQYTTTREGARFQVGLYDRTGQLVALMSADKLGQMRTGAVTGVAVKHLAAPDVRQLGLFGTGWQARSQLAAVAAVRKIDRAVVYGRDADRRRAFATEVSEELGIDVVPASNPRDAVDGMPVVVTATTSKTPVFEGDWLASDVLVCAIGSNWLNKAEIDVSTVRRATRIVCDDVDCCRHEAGDFVPALEAGVFDWAAAENLGEAIVAGGRDGTGVTVFKSVGMAIEDVAVAAELVKLARDAGVGTTSEL